MSAPGFLSFLDQPSCAQDENHLTWVLKCVIEADAVFRDAFLGQLCGGRKIEQLRQLEVAYQRLSVYSRPDLTLRAITDRQDYVWFVEIKVESPVDLEQLGRHRRGQEMEKWLYARGREAEMAILLVAPRESMPANLPGWVVAITWEEICNLLRESSSAEQRNIVVVELARILEARGMADFAGFDVNLWREYVDIHRRNAKVLEQVESQSASLISTLKRKVHTAIVGGRPPFDHFDSRVHDRGKTLEFYVCPKQLAEAESHWVISKADLKDGSIEVSSGTETLENSARFLQAVGSEERTLAQGGWELWYDMQGVEDFVELSRWKELLKTRVAAVSLAKLWRLSSDRDLLTQSGFADQCFAKFTEAADFLLRLLG